MTPEQQVAEMERIISYTFNDRHLAVESLYHGGFPIHFDGDWITPQRNERLAIMGDSLLDTLLIRKWLTTVNGAGKSGTLSHRDLLTCCRPSSPRSRLDGHHPQRSCHEQETR